MEKVENKWKTVTSLTDDELKEIAKDIYNGKIYTDRHCQNPNDIMSIFMPLIFMGPNKPTVPKHPNPNTGIENKRDNVLYDLIQKDLDQVEYEKNVVLYELEKKDYDKYLESIGLIYEYISQSGPICVNGCPTFMSIRFLNKDDTERMFEYYNKYDELRKQSDNF